MGRTLNEKLKYLQELEQSIRDTVEEIKLEAKKEAMTQVQDYLLKSNSEEAKKMIDKIEELKTLSLSVNIKSIHEFVLTMLNMDSEERRFSSNKSGTQFQFDKSIEKEDVKDIMKKKGFSFVEYVEGNLKFEKDGEFYFAVEVNEKTETKELEDSLNDASKFCNLVLITDSEYAKKQLKQRVEGWLNKSNDNYVLKKYLTIQLGSLEHLTQKGTVLERMNIA